MEKGSSILPVPGTASKDEDGSDSLSVDIGAFTFFLLFLLFLLIAATLLAIILYVVWFQRLPSEDLLLSCLVGGDRFG